MGQLVILVCIAFHICDLICSAGQLVDKIFMVSFSVKVIHWKNIYDIIFCAGQVVNEIFVSLFSVLVNQLKNICELIFKRWATRW